MTKAPFYRRPLFILMSTLLIGALIGAALTGMIVQNRLESARQFTNAKGFETLTMGVIEPVSAEQRAQIKPIVASAAQNVERIFADSRIALNQSVEQMQQELEPHLTDEQMTRLRERRQLVRERYNR